MECLAMEFFSATYMRTRVSLLEPTPLLNNTYLLQLKGSMYH